MKFAILATFLFVASVTAFPVGEVKDLENTVAVEVLPKAAEEQPADDLQTAASFNFGASDLGLAKGAVSWDFESSASSSSSSSEEEEKHTHFTGNFHGGHGGHDHVHYGGHAGHGGHGGRAYGGNTGYGGNGVYGETTS